MTQIGCRNSYFLPSTVQEAVECFPLYLHLRDFEELVAERGIVVSWETNRRRMGVRTQNKSERRKTFELSDRTKVHLVLSQTQSPAARSPLWAYL